MSVSYTHLDVYKRQAKLRVLTAMTHHAKLLIMDEPTAGLDVEARNEILDMLRAYIAEEMCIRDRRYPYCKGQKDDQ